MKSKFRTMVFKQLCAVFVLGVLFNTLCFAKGKDLGQKLLEAVKNRNMSLVMKIVSKHPDVITSQMIVIALEKEFISLVLELAKKSPKSITSPVLTKVMEGKHPKLVKYFMKINPDTSIITAEVIGAAIGGGRTKLALELARKNSSSITGWVVRTAIGGGHKKLALELAKRNPKGITASVLIKAMRGKYPKLAKYFVEINSNSNIVTEWVIRTAIERGYTILALEFAKKNPGNVTGLVVEATIKEGYTTLALELAKRNPKSVTSWTLVASLEKNVSLFHNLINANPDPNIITDWVLVKAIEKGHTSLALELARKNPGSVTGLVVEAAIRGGHTTLALALVRKNPNNVTGWVLISALHKRDIRLFDNLMKVNPDPNIITDEVLAEALRGGYTKLAKNLIKRNPDPNIITFWIVDTIMEVGEKEPLKFITEDLMLDIGKVDKNGWTLRHKLIDAGYEKVTFQSLFVEGIAKNGGTPVIGIFMAPIYAAKQYAKHKKEIKSVSNIYKEKNPAYEPEAKKGGSGNLLPLTANNVNISPPASSPRNRIAGIPEVFKILPIGVIPGMNVLKVFAKAELEITKGALKRGEELAAGEKQEKEEQKVSEYKQEIIALVEQGNVGNVELYCEKMEKTETDTELLKAIYASVFNAMSGKL
ncbi:MAG TPA: hypothetical protein VMW66_04200, partial [Elusimicrobiales bacterium]|nr:hypothetical protein [Elusimicrobiales bacterium]